MAMVVELYRLIALNSLPVAHFRESSAKQGHGYVVGRAFPIGHRWKSAFGAARRTRRNAHVTGEAYRNPTTRVWKKQRSTQVRHQAARLDHDNGRSSSPSAVWRPVSPQRSYLLAFTCSEDQVPPPRVPRK
jgi:hypothetical protein